jgi:Flp pilus assembly protein TadD
MAGWPAAAALCAAIGLAILGGCGGAGRDTDEPRAAPATLRLLAAARLEERARRHDRARELYQRAAREAPDRPSAALAWRELGRARLFWGELTGGEAALARAVELGPGDAGAWHDLGVVRGERGDAAGAERALRRAVALAPGDPRPRIALAALLVRGRRWPDALREYRALQRMDLPDRLRDAVARAIALVEAEAARPPAR